MNPDLIRGKWHGRTYRVIRELGRGSAGIVYEVRTGRHTLALKIGEDALSLTSEVNVLQQLAQVRGVIPGPSLYDADDWQTRHGLYPFYVMNRIDGVPMVRFLQRRGQEWMPVLVLQLLGFLEQLHRQGWVFGDLKPDNLLVTGAPPTLAWLDPGGMTRIGRAVREYTERFDRGFWQMGDRKAEPAYDLFSVAMIVLDVSGQVVQLPDYGENSPKQLRQMLRHAHPLVPYQSILWKALHGEYRQAGQMKGEWLKAWQHRKQRPAATSPAHKMKAKRPTARNAGKTGGLLSFFFVSSFLLFLFALLLFLQVF